MLYIHILVLFFRIPYDPSMPPFTLPRRLNRIKYPVVGAAIAIVVVDTKDPAEPCELIDDLDRSLEDGVRLAILLWLVVVVSWVTTVP